MAGKYNFDIDQGSCSRFTFQFQDDSKRQIDLAGFEAAMQLRKVASSDEVVDTLTTENGRLVIDASAGSIQVNFDSDTTEKYPARALVYDLEIESSDGNVTRVLEGMVKVNAEVTRVSRKR